MLYTRLLASHAQLRAAPSSLAAMVASASGLDRWEAESAAARTEVASTRRALQDVSAAMEQLRATQGAHSAALEQHRVAVSLERDLEGLLARLGSGLRMQLTALTSTRDAAHMQLTAQQVRYLSHNEY